MAFTLAALAVAVVLGLALGGRPRDLGRRHVGAVAVLGLGIGVQVVPDVAGVDGASALALVLGSYALLAAFVLRNLRLVGMPVVLLGLCLNAVVIGVNGGMPVRASSLLRADVVSSPAAIDGLDLGAKRRLERPGDRLVLLGDVVPVPVAREVLSFGDLILAFGVGNVVFRLLRPVAVRRREEAQELDADVVVFPPATVRPLRRSA